MKKVIRKTGNKSGLFKIFAAIHFEKIIFTALCIGAFNIQMKYRVSSSIVSLFMPWLGIVLAALSFFILINEYCPHLFAKTLFKKTLAQMEWGTKLSIRIFVYYSLFLFANGILDIDPLVDRPATIESISAGEWNLDLPVPYQLATVAFYPSDKRGYFLLNKKERRRLWGGASVVVVTHPGYFGLPWISSIDQDMEVYSKKTLALTPTASEAWRNLIRFYTAHERWQEASQTMQDYLKIYPYDDAFALNIAGELNVAGRYKDGIPILERIVDVRPSYEGYQLLGYALSWSGKRKRAAMFLEKSVLLNPADWQAYYHLGYTYYDSGKLPEAEKNFIEVLKRRPHFPEIEKLLENVRHINMLKEKIRKKKQAAKLVPQGN